jgi:hypothetical protein
MLRDFSKPPRTANAFRYERPSTWLASHSDVVVSGPSDGCRAHFSDGTVARWEPPPASRGRHDPCSIHVDMNVQHTCSRRDGFATQGAGDRGIGDRWAERGAGLIEILVALLILSFAVMGISRSTMSSRRAGDSGRFQAEATILAMDKVENLRMRPATASELADGLHLDPGPLQPHPGGGIYTRSWRITSDQPEPGMKTMEMFVAWPSQLGGRSIRLVTSLGLL